MASGGSDHRDDRQLCRRLLHPRVPRETRHLSQQAQVYSGPDEHHRHLRHRPLLLVPPPRGSRGLRDYREDGEDDPPGESHEDSKDLQARQAFCWPSVPVLHSPASLSGIDFS